jgi:hypothetical protein
VVARSDVRRVEIAWRRVDFEDAADGSAIRKHIVVKSSWALGRHGVSARFPIAGKGRFNRAECLGTCGPAPPLI